MTFVVQHNVAHTLFESINLYMVKQFLSTPAILIILAFNRSLNVYHNFDISWVLNNHDTVLITADIKSAGSHFQNDSVDSLIPGKALELTHCTEMIRLAEKPKESRI